MRNSLARTYSKVLDNKLKTNLDLVRYTLMRILNWNYNTNNKSDYDVNENVLDIENFINDYSDHYDIKLNGNETSLVLQLYNLSNLTYETIKTNRREEIKDENLNWLEEYQKVQELKKTFPEVISNALTKSSKACLEEIISLADEVKDYYTPLGILCNMYKDNEEAWNGIYNVSRYRAGIPKGQQPKQDSLEQSKTRLIFTILMIKEPGMINIASQYCYSESKANEPIFKKGIELLSKEFPQYF